MLKVDKISSKLADVEPLSSQFKNNPYCEKLIDGPTPTRQGLCFLGNSASISSVAHY